MHEEELGGSDDEGELEEEEPQLRQTQQLKAVSAKPGPKRLRNEGKEVPGGPKPKRGVKGGAKGGQKREKAPDVAAPRKAAKAAAVPPLSDEEIERWVAEQGWQVHGVERRSTAVVLG
jgi:hypothetical protein